MAGRISIRGNRILRMFFASFLIATLIPVAALGCVYSVTLRSMEEEIVSRNTVVLEQCQQAADSIFTLAENVTTALSFDPASRRFAGLYCSYSSRDLAVCVKDLDESVSIQRYVMDQANIVELGVYSSRAGAVVSTGTGYARAGNYFIASLRVNDPILLADIMDCRKFSFHTVSDAALFGRSRHAIFATAPIFSSSSRRIEGASVYAMLDASELYEILGDALLSEDCFAFIADSTGTVLIQNAGSSARQYAHIDDIDVSADDYIILSSRDKSGRIYTAYVSSDVIYEKVSYIRGIMLLVSLLGLCVGVLASFVLALRTSRPVMDIYDIVKGGDSSPAAAPISYDYLKGTISGFISSNAALSERMEQYMSYSRRDFIRRLTDGSAFLPGDIDSRARALGIDIEARTYAALLVRCPALPTDDPAAMESSMSDMSNAWMLVEKAFSECAAFVTLPGGYNACEMPLLILMANDDEDVCAHLLTDEVTRISNELRAQFNLPVSCVCGGLTHEITAVGALFMYAHDAAGSEGDLTFATPRKDMPVCYSLHEEMQLAKAISAGECGIAQTLASALMERNLPDASRSPESMRVFRHALYTTVSRAVDGSAARDEMLRKAAFLLDEHMPTSARALPGAMRDLITDIIALNRRSSESRDKERLNQILDYIRAQLSDPEFTLYNVSEAFGLPESYLYRYIRSESGSTFAALLERYRMERAAQLLVESDITVDEVARLTGYNSTHAFRRVFKKCYDILPTQYRNTMLNNSAPSPK